MDNLINIKNEDGKSAAEEKKQLVVIDERELLGKQFRIYGDVENPLFLAKEVAEWIEHSNSRMMLQGVDEDEKVVRNVYTLGGNQEQWFLTEDGMYEVLMQSRKPIAKQFKKEVKNILRTIRKHGAYMTDATIEKTLTDPDFIIGLATELKKERQRAKELELTTKKQEQIIGELKPSADYTDRILKNRGLVTITQIAKDYGMSGTAMNKLLNELKIQYKQSDQWLLYRNHSGKGYTHSETIDITRSDGRPDISMITKWTQKGRLFLYEVLKAEGYVPTIERN
ncbi:phage antirepressor protein KilAC domain protein [Andreesenia angusta]|uniref:Phage antirepressor protein KilAC domain protein n=1 Tax=Andreesenia angusta TaxID=39480 RepID=A0A1S1V6E7_9FIRM|nr:phage antirepressor KilAC domain-containing protein [Andreesenia angusta]OHW62198.1 phage antirepressor protein KilAC domain protein [Andreesenia angusta]